MDRKGVNRNSEAQIKVLWERLFAKDDLPPPFNKGLSGVEIASFLEKMEENPPTIEQYVLEAKITYHPQFVRLVPELSPPAFKLKLDKQLALWYALRAINPWGSGNLVLSDAITALCHSFGYSQRNIYRLLGTGKGKFWDTRAFEEPHTGASRTRIKIYSLLRICEHLGAYHVKGFVEVPASAFQGLKGKRSWLYASHHKPQGCTVKPISRSSLEVATGVRRRTQQRYDKVTGTVKVSNFADQQNSEARLVPILHLVQGKSKQWFKHRRLGNTYHSRVLKAARGMTKKVNALFRQSLKRGEACLPKRFFFSPRSFARTTEKHQEPFLWVKPKERIIPGRVEWCLV
jgi:hypothetical protein